MNIIIDPTPEQWDAINRLQFIGRPHIALPEDGDNGDLHIMVTVDTQTFSYLVTADGTITGETVNDMGDGWIPAPVPAMA